MPGGSRRVSKNSKSQNVHSTSLSSSTAHVGDLHCKYSTITGSGGYSVANVEVTSAPKHIPFPTIPLESELEFEIIMFIFTTVAAALQFLQIYRSVWWLPHAYTNQAVVRNELFILLMVNLKLIKFFVRRIFI